MDGGDQPEQAEQVPPRWPTWAEASRSRLAPPLMVHKPDSHWRSGESEPFSEAWAVTAKISPVSRARRLPLAARTSMRDEQPRARIMPMPNSSRRATMAPERAAGGR